MAKRTYTGVDGKARKVKRGYAGIDRTARKVKKAYIGVGGVARPCWSSGELAYYGNITPLSSARSRVQGTAVGKYALLAGGTNSSDVNSVDAYDTTLTKFLPASLSKNTCEFGAATTGNYAICAGVGRSTTVDVYDADLTKSSRSDFGYTAERQRGAEAGDRAVFAGLRQGDTTPINAIVAYNGDLTRQTASMTEAKTFACMNRFDGKAVIAGGQISYPTTRSAKVEFITSDLTVATTTMPVARQGGSCASGSDFLFICGGNLGTSEDYSSDVQAFDKDMTRYSADDLSAANNMFGANLTNGAMFAEPGYTDFYDDHLTKTVITGLNPIRNSGTTGARAPVIGDFLICAGGHHNGTPYNTVDAYTFG